MQSDNPRGRETGEEVGLTKELSPWVIFKLNPIRPPHAHLTVQSGTLPSQWIHLDRPTDKCGGLAGVLALFHCVFLLPYQESLEVSSLQWPASASGSAELFYLSETKCMILFCSWSQQCCFHVLQFQNFLPATISCCDTATVEAKIWKWKVCE